MTDKKTETQKNKKKAWSISVVKHWLYFAYLHITYRVFHRSDKGWMIRKRLWIFTLLSPILLPFFMLYGIVMYYEWATNYYIAWIEGEKRKLSLQEKIVIKHQLHK